MQFFTRLFAFLLTFTAVFALGGNVGGWTKVDPKNKEVLKMANFAIGSKYHTDPKPDFTLVAAKKQVVSGIQYDLIIDVQLSGSDCKVEHFVVYDKFGKKSVTTSEILKTPCQSSGSKPGPTKPKPAPKNSH